jgi:hypothetical protein
VTDDPRFLELVGDDGPPEELERLRRVHDLLVAAGPPAELSPALEKPPAVTDSKIVAFRKRRPATVIALAAALAVCAFVAGYVVADHRTGFSAERTVPMHGVGQFAAARASLQIGGQDAAGNYPMEMIVHGLKRLPKGGWYELLLSKNGKPTLSCGVFRGQAEAQTIRLSVPYDLDSFPKLFNGWVVTRHLPTGRSTAVVLTT